MVKLLIIYADDLVCFYLVHTGCKSYLMSVKHMHVSMEWNSMKIRVLYSTLKDADSRLTLWKVKHLVKNIWFVFICGQDSVTYVILWFNVHSISLVWLHTKEIPTINNTNNNVFRRFLGYDKYCSASSMFVENRTDGFDACIFLCYLWWTEMPLHLLWPGETFGTLHLNQHYIE